MSIIFKGEVDRNAAYFVLPIAFELQRDPVTGTVICGDETAAACRAAVSITHDIRNRGGCANVNVTAGHVGNGWYVTMCEVMKDLIIRQMGTKMWSNEVPEVIASPAQAFNTEGELRHLLTLMDERTMMRRPHIIVTAKNWHVARIWILLLLLGWEKARTGHYMPDWTIVKIPSNVPYLHRMREFIAIPENFFRIVWKNLRSRR